MRQNGILYYKLVSQLYRYRTMNKQICKFFNDKAFSQSSS